MKRNMCGGGGGEMWSVVVVVVVWPVDNWVGLRKGRKEGRKIKMEDIDLLFMREYLYGSLCKYV